MSLDPNWLGLSIPIAFGVTGGLLTLVGLVSVFVSITTQQHIQKMKEIHYNLMQIGPKINRLSNSFSNKFEAFQSMSLESIEIIKNFKLLDMIYESKGEKVPRMVTTISITSLIGVICVWMYLGMFPLRTIEYKYFWSNILMILFGTVMLGFFIKTLILLRNHQRIIDYSPNSILDVKQSAKTKVDTLSFLGLVASPIFSETKVEGKHLAGEEGEVYLLFLSLPFPFINFRVTAKIQWDEDREGEVYVLEYSTYFGEPKTVEIASKDVYIHDKFNDVYLVPIYNAAISKKVKDDEYTIIFEFESTEPVSKQITTSKYYCYSDYIRQQFRDLVPYKINRRFNTEKISIEKDLTIGESECLEI